MPKIKLGIRFYGPPCTLSKCICVRTQGSNDGLLQNASATIILPVETEVCAWKIIRTIRTNAAVHEATPANTVKLVSRS